jgi:hypothetical protein
VTFRFCGIDYDYFDHPYNRTATNERAVEIPVVRRWLERDGTGLEVGNVLNHYPPAPARRVVDKFEPGPTVENLDVLAIEGKYDWAVSISTMEHVRWDDPQDRDPDGAAQAIEHLLGLSQAALVTVPTGYHPPLDDWLAGADPTWCGTLVRSGDGWEQTNRPKFLSYGQGVWIGAWE